jgi:histidinol-phosphate aminotransferase
MIGKQFNSSTTIILILAFCVFLLCLYQIEPETLFKKNVETFGLSNVFKKTVSKEPEQLERKRILITAATSGLGYDLAKKLAKSNCKLFITGRNPDKIEKIIKEFRQYNTFVWGKAADFKKENEVEEMFKEAVMRLLTINTLIMIPIQTKNSFYLQRTTVSQWKEYQTKNFEAVLMLNNLVISHMRRNNGGKIINVSTYKGKYQTTKLAKGTEILSSNIVENHAKVLSEELQNDGIAVVSVRLDVDINNYNYGFDLEKYVTLPDYIKPVIKGLDKTIDSLSNHSKDVIPVFIYAIVSPYHEVNGRVLSTNSFNNNRSLQHIINPSKLALDQVYSKIVPSQRVDGATYLTKQNPFGTSIAVKELVKKNINKLEGVNDYTKYDGKLIQKLTNIYKLDKNNIIFFQTEEIAIKKLFEIFIGRYQSVESVFPMDNYFYLNLIENASLSNFSYTKLNENTKTTSFDLDTLVDNINSNTKCVYLSSPDTITGKSITKAEFQIFIDKIPDNVIVFLDQRFYEFSTNKQGVNGAEFINQTQNLFVLRSFNHFYSVKPLTLCYLLCKKSLYEYVERTMVVNEVDDFIEMIALQCLEDKKHYAITMNKIQTEKKRIQDLLDKHEIPWIQSDTNYFLIETAKSNIEVSEALKKENIIMVNGNDTLMGYWTLPVSLPKINNKVINTIIYSI